MGWVQGLLIGLIIILIVLGFATNAQGSNRIDESAGKILNIVAGNVTLTYIPGGGHISNPLKPPEGTDLDAVKITGPSVMADGYVYSVEVLPRLRVGGKGEQDVTAIIEFKGKSARAKEYSTNQPRDYFTAAAGTVSQPDLRADIVSPIPPITEFSSLMCDSYPVVVKSQAGVPLVVTAYVRDTWNGIYGLNKLPDVIQDYYSCNALFSFECDNEVSRVTEFMSGCDSPDPLDCEENIDVCGGVAHVNLLADPDCSNDKVEAFITYDGERQSTVNEKLKIWFFKKTDCTMETEDINALQIKCLNNDYITAVTLKAGMLAFQNPCK